MAEAGSGGGVDLAAIRARLAEWTGYSPGDVGELLSIAEALLAEVARLRADVDDRDASLAREKQARMEWARKCGEMRELIPVQRVCALCQKPYPDDGTPTLLYCRACLSANVERATAEAARLTADLALAREQTRWLTA